MRPTPNLIPVDFNPFEDGKEIEKISFTNDAQKEIWLSCIVGENDASLAYNESVSLDLKGQFYLDHFIASVRAVQERHEALRATVSADGETLIIYKNAAQEVPFEDLSDVADQTGFIRMFLDGQMHHVFSLQEGPLFKTFLHKLGEQHFLFTIVKHHIIGDGWSTGVILEDLSKIYNSKVQGVEPALPVPVQISKYASDTAKYKLTPDFKKTQEYWLNVYKDDIPVLDLPTDFPRPAFRTYAAKRLDFKLPMQLIDELKIFGAKVGSSLVNTLLCAFEVFLFRETNQDDLVVGLPTAGQSATGNFNLVGHCVNLLPLRTRINSKNNFETYLKSRKSAFFDAYDHQQFTFGELISQLKVKRDPSRIPLVPVVFNIDMGMSGAVEFNDLTYSLISNPRAYETFELFLNVTGSSSAFTFEWSYNTQLFKAETITRMARDFELLLGELVENPQLSIAELIPADKNKEHRQNQNWNTTVTDYPKDKIFSAYIDAFALKSPNKTAVICGDKKLSYHELRERSDQMACYLIDKGIQPGDLIGLAAERSIEMLVCLLAIVKAGAAYIPLDPEYPRDRIEFMLSDSEAKIIIISKKYQGKFKSKALELTVEDLQKAIKKFENQIPAAKVTGSDLAYILYTSGSTGKPKGVKIKHNNLANFLLSMQAEPGIAEADRLLAVTTVSFDISGLELYLPLISGAELIICDAEAAKDARLLIDLVEKHEITFMQATPSTWKMMIDVGWTSSRSSLKILCGGEALPKEVAEQLMERSASLWNMYGPTETTIWSTIKKLEKTDAQITIGHPIQNTQVYILNEDQELVAPGITGEIFIGGEGVAQGYLNRDELTEERFVADRFGDAVGSKLYRTGDLGKLLENGEILYQGRIDQQVKIHGHRIELGEIESVLNDQPEINQAVVVAKADESHNKRLVAYVTLEKDPQLDATAPSWKDRWDTIYDMAAKSNESPDADKTIDGILLEQWENSELLIEQAGEWLKVSTERIKALKAKNIMEIGSGGGQLLFELAPYCESYLATDYAETAISKLNEKLATSPEKWKHVTAQANAADDFSQLSSASFDLILIHSVAQYFPNSGYFLKVIENSIKRLNKGGCLFIGDMQGKNSLKMYHAKDHLSNTKPDTTLAEFENVVDNRVRIEDEFVADPAFFYLLPQLFPSITGVDVQLRQGQSQNETTKYHYDIWIYVNSEHTAATAELVLEWRNLNSIAALEQYLNTDQRQIVEVKNIFNSRTAEDYILLEWMASADPGAFVKDIIAQIERNGNLGIHPDVFWQLGAQHHYSCHIRWSTDGTDGNFDVVFIPENFDQILPVAAWLPENAYRAEDFARTPIHTNEIQLSKSVTDYWKLNLGLQLPDYMIPVHFVALKSFPLTPNQKIDRNSLPDPQFKSSNAEKINQQLNEYEKIISDIWSATLGLSYIDIKDDFFELGGHSLLAVKVMAAIEKETGKRLPLATLFKNATIEKLAKQIHAEEEEEWDSLVPIKTSGSKDPVYLIHGGGLNVMFYKPIIDYMDDEQPIYGLQAIGLYKDRLIPPTIEEISSIYINDLLKINPDGPYCLAGYSFGGIIAFEMAKQLTRLGKQVKFVGIVDTYVGNRVDQSTGMVKVMKKIRRQFFKIPHVIQSVFKFPKDAILYQLGFIRYKLLGFLPIDEPEKLTQPGGYVAEFTPYERKIYDVYNAAHENYLMTPADVKISLLRVTKRLYYVDDANYLGWKKLSKKGVDIYLVPGDHGSILHPPNDYGFARALQKALDDAK